MLGKLPEANLGTKRDQITKNAIPHALATRSSCSLLLCTTSLVDPGSSSRTKRTILPSLCSWCLAVPTATMPRVWQPLRSSILYPGIHFTTTLIHRLWLSKYQLAVSVMLKKSLLRRNETLFCAKKPTTNHCTHSKTQQRREVWVYYYCLRLTERMLIKCSCCYELNLKFTWVVMQIFSALLNCVIMTHFTQGDTDPPLQIITFKSASLLKQRVLSWCTAW